jgi:futalosine hydrolase
MRILLVSATSSEVAPLLTALTPADPESAAGDRRRQRLTPYGHQADAVDVLVTGVGMVATAAWCSHVLAGGERYDLALNIGVCGSFDADVPPGSVVHVVSDRLAELGAEDGDAFLPIEELNLPGEHEFVNVSPPNIPALAALLSVRGITVNTVHGNPRTIEAVVRRLAPQVETMEGAAFMYACLIHGVPFAQVRAVSNVIEKRNRAAWKMPEAIENLCAAALRIFQRT